MGLLKEKPTKEEGPLKKQLSNCTGYLLKKGGQKKKRRGKEGRHEPSKIRQGILGLVVKRVGGFLLLLHSSSLSSLCLCPYPPSSLSLLTFSCFFLFNSKTNKIFNIYLLFLI